jgi:hypothetical protein
MNSNLFHNIANIANLVLAALMAGLISTGCVAMATGGLDCSASWIDATYVGYALVVVNALKIGVNVVRDGLGGLFKTQPPVQ